MVLLQEDNTPPLQWPTAIITETYPGKDGVVRVVTLKTPKGTSKRPITKICPLLRVNSELQLSFPRGGRMFTQGQILLITRKLCIIFIYNCRC